MFHGCIPRLAEMFTKPPYPARISFQCRRCANYVSCIRHAVESLVQGLTCEQIRTESIDGKHSTRMLGNAQSIVVLDWVIARKWNVLAV